MPHYRTVRMLFRPAVEGLRFLPEGPYPTQHNGEVSWVAIQHGPKSVFGSINLLTFTEESLRGVQNRSFDLPGRPGFAFPCDDDLSFVVGLERSLGLFTPQTGSWEVFCEGIDSDVENTIINDGMIWEDNLIFGTKDLEFNNKKAGLYLYRGCDRSLIRLRNDQICSNGKAIRKLRDGVELIDIDSPTRQVCAYDLDISAGRLGPRRILLDLTDDPAVPDGAILTPDGRGLIVSMFHPTDIGTGETRWYSLDDGQLVEIWQTPGSPQNTCPNLVSCDGKIVLLITTAAENMTPERLAACPNAGCIFVGETGFERVTPMPLWRC